MFNHSLKSSESIWYTLTVYTPYAIPHQMVLKITYLMISVLRTSYLINFIGTNF